MIYCDTSLLIAALTVEAETRSVQHWLADRAAGELCISGWVVAEFSGALSLKHRRGDLTAEQRAAILAKWSEMQREILVAVPVPQEAFTLAARFADMPIGLRTGDALHLAVASLGGHALATLDQRMRDGALAVGVRVEVV